VEGEDNNTGPSGAKTDVRDSLDGAWAQIEEIRAQMGQRSDRDAGADKPTHELRHPSKVEDHTS
jgi:hypothetical protein